MATDKKHIAVYLTPEVEQALIAFCERKGLKSKKGTMFSAGVNAALSEFFGISNVEESNTPQEASNISPNPGNTLNEISNISPNPGNTLNKISNISSAPSNILTSADDTILPGYSNIPSESLVVEVMPEKHHLSKSEAESLRQELEEVKADRAKLLKSSTHITNKLRQEVHELRSQLETERADREQVEAELAEVKQNPGTASRNLPEAADLLNRFKTRRKKSTVSLADVETLLEIIEKFCDDTLAGL
jgi:hypothetical protein